MTCDFWWTLICPSLLFVFVCPSVGGLGMLYVLQSARRLVNQSGKSGERTEINNFRKRALRLYQLGPIPLHPPFKNGFCSSRFSQKGSSFLSRRVQYMRTVLTHNVLQLVRLAIPAFRGLSPFLIYSSEAANAQGASCRAHSCGARTGVYA